MHHTSRRDDEGSKADRAVRDGRRAVSDFPCRESLKVPA